MPQLGIGRDYGSHPLNGSFFYGMELVLAMKSNPKFLGMEVGGRQNAR